MNPIIAGKPEQFPKNYWKEIVIIGRSNAGKSTLINSLTKSKEAYVSKAPGKTQTINFFEIKNYYLIDMPGYGYSRHGQTKQKQFSNLISTYLNKREQLVGIIHICSILGMTEQDLEVKDFFSSTYDNYILLLNKIDKLGNQKLSLAIKEITKKTNLSEEQIIPISAKMSKNMNILKKKMNDWIA